MLVPISWLKEYVDINIPLDDLIEKITLAGLEVEKVHYIGVPGGNDKDRLIWDRELLIIGQILKVEQHPNADRLVLATVEYGGSDPEVVVTGAPNLFDYVGKGDLSAQQLLSPFALEGAVVYDGHKEGNVKMKLKGKSLRGIHNRCMVCSAKELGLGEEHDGVMLFSAADLNLETLAPGTPVQDVFGDVVIEFDLIPNIARCASIVGVAREVAALTGETLRTPDYTVVQTGEPVDGAVKITTANPDLNPRFVAFKISGVDVTQHSPLWMRRRLEAVGQRPINVVVDVSNYVMLEMGQPNHTFDYDFMRQRADEYAPDGPIHIHTRLAEDGETLTTLDGVVRELPPYTILVTDPAGNLSIGGIMGGGNSEITATTQNVLLEAAAWNFMNIRRSSHALKLHSEAGFRFSRGVHPSQALLGAKRAAELLRRHAGGTVAQGIIDYYPQPAEVVTVEMTVDYLRRWSGLDLTAVEIKALLEPLEFSVKIDGNNLHITTPDHRIDIEGPHDIVEEVCRMYGYDRIPAVILDEVLPPQRANTDLEGEEHIKDLLVAEGLQEIITYRLTSPEREAKLLPQGTPPDDRPYLEIANPISPDRNVMRHSLLASVAEIAAQNSRSAERIALFEIGAEYIVSEDGDLPDENRRLSILLTGNRNTAHWRNNGTPSPFDFFDLKGIVESLTDKLHVAHISYEAGTHPSYRPGRTARLLIGEKQLGWIGELHPLVVEALDFGNDQPVLAATLDLDLLQKKVRTAFKVDPISIYPAVREDLALVVDQDLSAAVVQEVIEKSGGFLLKEVELFDVYTGKSIPTGKKSLAYHLTFQAPDKTLKDKDVAKIRRKIIGSLDHRLGAKLRE